MTDYFEGTAEVDSFIYKKNDDNIEITRSNGDKIGLINIRDNEILTMKIDDDFDLAMKLYKEKYKKNFDKFDSDVTIEYTSNLLPYKQEKGDLSIIQKLDIKLPQVTIGVAIVGLLLFFAFTIIAGLWVIPAFVFAYRAEQWIADHGSKYGKEFSIWRVLANSLQGPFFINKYYRTFGTFSLRID